MSDRQGCSAACICDPALLPNVTDAQCPQHGVLAFLASGAADQPDAPDEQPAATPSHRIEKTWHDGGSVVGALCACGREGTIDEILEHIALQEQEVEAYGG